MPTTNMIRYGSDAPLPERRTLRAGPLTAVLEQGDLRYVRLGDVEVVRRLYMAVRDQNWDTIEPVYTKFDVEDGGDHFRVEMAVEHVSGEVDFAWTGVIEGTADGTIRASMDGAPRKSFLRNRIGFCVLHPMALAGEPAITETPDGTTEGAFPGAISPHQPFLDMQSISHAAGPNARVTIRFEGDLFEMEDQRNWTDASYKTYSTPLRLPYPVEVDPETRVAQTITISVEGSPAAPSQEAAAGPDLRVDTEDLLPMPPVSFGAGRKPVPSSPIRDHLRALSPASLWVTLDLGSDTWRTKLHEAADSARALNTSLDLSVIAGQDDASWDDLATELAGETMPVARIFVFPPVATPIIFPRQDLTTHDSTIAAARAAFSETAPNVTIGGGARSYFTELNRAGAALPIDQMDAVTYPLNPQVHAFDNLSIIEAIEAQAVTVASARAIAGDRPLVVGPVSFKPPYNPNATGPTPEPGPNELPPSVDPRQLSLLGAGWTVGSLHRLARAGADRLIYYELLGWRGLIELEDDLTRHELFPSEPGQIFPLYHVFAAASTFAEAEVAEAELADPLATEALVLVDGDRIRLLVANLSEEERDVSIDVPGLTSATVQTLDETTYVEASRNPDFFTQPGTPLAVTDGHGTVRLRPFAVARIDGTLMG